MCGGGVKVHNFGVKENPVIFIHYWNSTSKGFA